jgi:hypothetical protein
MYHYHHLYYHPKGIKETNHKDQSCCEWQRRPVPRLRQQHQCRALVGAEYRITVRKIAVDDLTGISVTGQQVKENRDTVFSNLTQETRTTFEKKTVKTVYFRCTATRAPVRQFFTVISK